MSSVPAPLSLRILITDNNTDSAQRMSEILISLEHTVVGQAQNGIELLTITKALGSDNVDLNVVDPTTPPEENNGFAASKEAYRRWTIPSIFYTSAQDPQSLHEWAHEDHVLGYVLKESPLPQLVFALGYARRSKTMRQINGMLFQACIFLAKDLDTTLSEAYERIRRYSMNTGKPLGKAAEEIVETLTNIYKRMK